MSTEHQRPVIVFDGICVLCNGWVRFLLRRDRGRYRWFGTTACTIPDQSQLNRFL